MQTRTASDLIRSYFFAYEVKDRAALEPLLAEDFTFRSPVDDNIGRTEYFERCGPNSANRRSFHLEHLFEQGNEAMVVYSCERADGGRFRNAEFFVTDGSGIRHVDVYFGTDSAGVAAESAVRGVIEGTVEAIRRRDAGALMMYYDPEVKAFDLLVPLHYKGREALRERAEQWLSSFDEAPDYELHDLQVTASESAAFSHSLNHVRGKQAGKTVDMWWRATLCFQKEGACWLIRHAHNSVPFDMGTGRAALDATP